MIRFSVYADGNFLFVGNKVECARQARAVASLYKRVEIVYDHRLTVRSYINGKVEA